MAATKELTKVATKDVKNVPPVPPKAQLKAQFKTAKPPQWMLWRLLVIVISFATRFYRLQHPDQVVFDEVHFGKFASYYLQGTYFFDVHPPMAKILIALVGKLVGYDGSFLFENIGLNYKTSGAPYVAYRAWSAFQGALIAPLIFETLKDTGFSLAGTLLGASLVLFDNALVTQTRLILLDATLVVTVAASVACYAKFRNHSHYSFKWFFWLFMTGVSLAGVISSKYVGVFTFAMIGFAVAQDLWALLDLRAGLTLRQWYKQFATRFFLLVVVPFGIFLFWFWLHFAMLPNSGPGNDHMSASFQETLKANPTVMNAMQINYFDVVTIQSKTNNMYLTSLDASYPVHYPDGRVSTGGQQVSAGDAASADTQWQILPEDPNIQFDPNLQMPILGSDNVVRLRHVATDTILVTHDVASPGWPTNEEFTTVPIEKALGDKYSDSRFRLHLPRDPGQAVRTDITRFYLEHVNTPVAMWMSERQLPDWGFGLVEINGNKQRDDKCLWYFGDITSVEDKQSRRQQKNKEAKHKSFLSKYIELQGTMFRSNNNLKDTHPYQSDPLSWPLLIKGISFWSSSAGDKSQIYLIGNFAAYLVEAIALVVYPALILVDQVTRLRQYPLMTEYSRTKLYGPLLWFYVGWAVHYFPFFLMGRQLFFHHYLPAYIIAALLTGGVFDVLFGQVDAPNTLQPLQTTKMALLPTLLCIAYCFYQFAPLAYGLPLTTEQIQFLEWNKIMLHFNK